MISQLRAALVALHLAVITFAAMPSAGSGMNRSAWKQPTVQGEFDAWTERLRGFGYEGTSAELQDSVWAFASRYESARSAALRPFRRYFEICGTWQSWKMFIAPHRFPGRLEIEIDEGAGFTPIYVARSATYDWRARWLDHDRFRAATFRYAWDHYKQPRREFADWVARGVASDYPQALRVRVSFVRYRTRSPEEVRGDVHPVEKRELAQTRDLPR